MTTEQKPVELTAEMAQRILSWHLPSIAPDDLREALEALASGRIRTYDPSTHVLCEREPVAWEEFDAFSGSRGLATFKADLGEESSPLYRAVGVK